MNYINSKDLSLISNKTNKLISQGFRINSDYCLATTDLVNYKDIVLAVNAYFLRKDEQGNYSCQLEFVIPSNRVLPTFELHTSSPNLLIFIVGVVVMGICYLLAKIIGLYVGILYVIGIIALIYGFFNSIFTIFRKLRMRFPNSEFNKKYTVSGENVDQIRKFFNDKLCFRLANYELNHNVKTENNLIILETFYDSFKEENLYTKLTSFLEEAINVAIIFHDTGKKESVSNTNNLDLTVKKLVSYYRTRCSENKANPF